MKATRGQQRQDHENRAQLREATHGLTREDLLRAYRTMVLSRKIDDKEIQLKNQSLIFFQISGAGHEAVLVAAGMHLKAGLRLVLSLLPRPRPLPVARHDAARDAAERGRRERRSQLRRPADALPLGAQGAEHRLAVEPDRHAVPAGDRLRRSRRALRARSRRSRGARRKFQKDEVAYVSIGEGTSSEGEFWESLNSACIGKLPVVYMIEDNGYAISVPVEVQTAGGDLSKLVASFPGLFVQSIDGTDFMASYQRRRRGGRLRARAQGPGADPRAR